MRKYRNVLNESFSDNLLSTIFRINQKEHTNISGEKEGPLSPDGAKFALSFPLPWDKLTENNLEFFGDSKFVNEVPVKNSLIDNPSGDNSASEYAQKILSRYNTQSYVKNADYRKEMIRLLGSAKSDFGRVLNEFDFSKRSQEGILGDFLYAGGKNTGFFDKVKDAKENRYIADSDYKLLKDWKKVLGYRFVSMLKKTSVDLLDRIIDEYVSVSKDADGKHKLKTGVNFSSLLSNEYLDNYTDIRQIGKVPVSEFIKRSKEELRSVISDDTDYEYAVKSLEKANERRIEHESNLKSGDGVYDKSVVRDYIFGKKLICHEYLIERMDQFKKYPELGGYVSKNDSDGETWTTKKIYDNEVSVLKRVYNEINSELLKHRTSDVYDILVALQRMNKFTGDNTEVTKNEFYSSIVAEMGDPSRLNKSGDVGIAIYMGADLKIHYVISSVCVDTDNYNMIGTYDNTRKYVYGWSHNKRLTTVVDDALRKLNGMGKKTEDVITFNQIPVSEIKSNNNVHCVLFIKGTSDSRKVESTDEEMTKFILSNISGVGIKVSHKDKKTDDGIKKVYKIETKDDTTSLYSIKDTLDSDNIPYEIAKVKDNKEYITIDKKYSRDVIDLAQRSKVGSAFLNTLFDDLDEKREVYNMFLPNLMSNDDFYENYYKMFKQLHNESVFSSKSVSKNVDNILSSIPSMLRDPGLYDSDRYDTELLKTIENTDSKKILVDILVTDKINEAIKKGKSDLKIYPISLQIKKEISDIVHDINAIMKQHDIPVQIDDIDIDEYRTLGQMIRSIATKQRYREDNYRWLNDRERDNKLKKSKYSYDVAKRDEKELKVIDELRERIHSSLADYDEFTSAIGRGSGINGDKLIKMADPSFVKMDNIKNAVYDVVTDAVSNISSDIQEPSDQIDALIDVLTYINNNIKVFKDMNTVVGGIKDDDKESTVDKKVTALRKYLTLMKGMTRKLRNVLQRYYGIQLTTSGPGE